MQYYEDHRRRIVDIQRAEITDPSFDPDTAEEVPPNSRITRVQLSQMTGAASSVYMSTTSYSESGKEYFCEQLLAFSPYRPLVTSDAHGTIYVPKYRKPLPYRSAGIQEQYYEILESVFNDAERCVATIIYNMESTPASQEITYGAIQLPNG